MITDLKLFQQYLQMELGLSSNSISAYLSDIIALKKFYHRSKNIDELEAIDLSLINSTDIVSFMAMMRKDTLSIDTILRRLSGVSQFFDYLLLEKRVSANPIDFIIKPKRWSKLPSFLNFDEIEKILQSKNTSTAKGIRDSLMIDMLYSSGMRVSELISVKILDIDFKRGIIKVIGKGSKTRIVPIYDQLLKNIQTYLPIRLDTYVKGEDTGYLFLNRFGKHLTRQYVWSWVKEICSIAGIKKTVSPHTLRHCFATHLLSGGADLRTIQIFLGHENIATTEIYTHLVDDDKRTVLENFHPRYRKN